MLNIGPQELIVILIVALVVVGPQRLPELGRTIGKALREFRKIQDDVKDMIKFDLNDDPEPYVRPTTTAPPSTPRWQRRERRDTAAADGDRAPTKALPDANGSVGPAAPDEPSPTVGPTVRRSTPNRERRSSRARPPA